MAVNLARQLCFRRGFLYRYYHGMHYHSRHFRSTAQRAIDELLVEGAAKHEGINVLSQSERLSILEAQHAIHAKTIDKGFDRIEAWIKLMVTFGGGTILFGLGTLAYKVMVYDIATNKEMRAHIERTVTASEQRTERTITASEQRTEAKLENLKQRTEDQLENLKQRTEDQLENLKLEMENLKLGMKNLKLEIKSELDNLRLAMELATRK